MIAITAINGLEIVLGLFVVGAIGALLFQKSSRLSHLWGHGFAVLGSFAGVLFSAAILLSEKTVSVILPTALPLLTIRIHIDPLAAFFMLIVSVIAFFSSVYGLGYMGHYYEKYNLGTFGFFYNLFIASMLLVFSAQQAVYFLIVWELMSLTSYMLVMFENKDEGNIQAGFTYFAMTHIATACIAFAFLLLYRATGSFDFDVLRAHASTLSESVQTVVLLLALVGFGTKAGIIPLHGWLPKAHPAAPAHVSALMSGVMIKTGIFMLIRFFVEILPTSALWSGVTLLCVGAVSTLLGVLYALTEHDLKRLLAYHSIENIGIILLGFGSALIFGSFGQPALMLLALIAALYHTANHAVFKALLFLGAGSVAHATHTRNIEEYGGLIKHMPWTALCFLIGAMAISGLPPFNGFVSEWITFQALFAGLHSSNTVLTIGFIVGIASLAFTGGLAAACFVKAFGATFLAKPRSEEASHAKECGTAMRFGMAGLALLSVVLGVGAGGVVPILSKVAQSISGYTSAVPALVATPLVLDARNQFAVLSMPLLAAVLGGLCLLVAVVVYCFTHRQKVTRDITWDCGSPLSSRTEITATGFSRSLLTIFQAFVRPTKHVSADYADARNYFPVARRVELGFFDIYEAYVYAPLNACAEHLSRTARKIQNGNVNAYIVYMGLTLTCLFIWISL